MLAVTSSPSSRPARIVPGLPHINSHRSSRSFAAISSDSRSRLACDGASLCSTSRIPVSPIHRLRSESVVRKIRRGFERALQIRDIVPSQLDEAPPREAVERSHDPRASEYTVRNRAPGSSSSSTSCGCIGQPSSNALSASATIEAIAARALSALHGSSASASCASGENSIARFYVRCLSVETTESILQSWKDTATRRAIVEFVERVATDGSPDYVPPVERIAVFDNDGTLWCEKPMPIELGFILMRLAEMAERTSRCEPANPGRRPTRRTTRGSARRSPSTTTGTTTT